MARAFSGTGQYLSVSASPISAAPFSVAAWAYSTNNTGTQQIWTQANNAGSTFEGWYLANNAGTMRFQTYAGGSGANADATTGTTTGQWNHVCGVTSSTTSRACYLNGTNKGTDTTSKSPTVATPKVGIGCWDVAGGGELWNGRIACVTLWDVALDDTDAAILATGIHPFLVKPVSITNHWELMGRFSPETDIAGGVDITVTSATQVDHPRIYGYIRRPYAHYGDYIPYTSPVLDPTLLLFPKEKMRLRA